MDPRVYLPQSRIKKEEDQTHSLRRGQGLTLSFAPDVLWSETRHPLEGTSKNVPFNDSLVSLFANLEYPKIWWLWYRYPEVPPSVSIMRSWLHCLVINPRLSSRNEIKKLFIQSSIKYSSSVCIIKSISWISLIKQKTYSHN